MKKTNRPVYSKLIINEISEIRGDSDWSDRITTFGSSIESYLKKSRSARFASGFIKYSGAEFIVEAVESNHEIESIKIYTSLDLGITDSRALQLLLRTPKIFLYVPAKWDKKPSDRGFTCFHPKIYDFVWETKRKILIGSANLSGPALALDRYTMNAELGVEYSIALNDERIGAPIDSWFKHTSSQFIKCTEEIISKYHAKWANIDSKMIKKEVPVTDDEKTEIRIEEYIVNPKFDRPSSTKLLVSSTGKIRIKSGGFAYRFPLKSGIETSPGIKEGSAAHREFKRDGILNKTKYKVSRRNRNLLQPVLQFTQDQTFSDPKSAIRAIFGLDYPAEITKLSGFIDELRTKRSPKSKET